VKEEINMKVKVTVTVDIDPEVWDLNYGTGTSAKAIREDVQRDAEYAIQSHFEQVGVLL
jgi:hypothetical protein